jgi:hypothetical protein
MKKMKECKSIRFVFLNFPDLNLFSASDLGFRISTDPVKKSVLICVNQCLKNRTNLASTWTNMGAFGTNLGAPWTNLGAFRTNLRTPKSKHIPVFRAKTWKSKIFI